MAMLLHEEIGETVIFEADLPRRGQHLGHAFGDPVAARPVTVVSSTMRSSAAFSRTVTVTVSSSPTWRDRGT